MIGIIISSIAFILTVFGLTVFAKGIIISLTGLFYGILISLVLSVIAWLLFSWIMTVAGLQKNEEDLCECRSWWKKWNKCLKELEGEEVKVPNDSCQFYWQTVGHMGWSPVFYILIPIVIIIAIAINLVIGRIPKLYSLIVNESSSDNPISFTEEHCRLSPVTMYGIIGIYFLFRFIGYRAENLNLVMLSTIWIWMIGIATSIGILILAILWKSELIKKFIGDCCEIAMDLKEAAKEKVCIRIVK